MIGRVLGKLRERLRAFWDIEDPETRIEGSGEVHLDPAYNGRYTAERRLQRLARAQEEAAERESTHPGPHEH